LVGATQPEDAAGAIAEAGVAAGEPVGETQLLGAEAVVDPAGATQLPEGALLAVAAPVLAGVDCNLASKLGDGLPSTGSPWDCS